MKHNRLLLFLIIAALFAIFVTTIQADDAAFCIKMQPEDYTGDLGETAIFAVVAEPAGDLSYQWQISADGGVTWIDLDDEESALAEFDTVITNDSPDCLFRCRVTDNNTGDSLYSEAVTVLINGEECRHRNIVTDEGVLPNCGQPGLSEGSHCKSCGAVIREQNVIPALGNHNYVKTVVKASGETRGHTLYTCPVCGHKKAEGPYDFSKYRGVVFAKNNRFTVPEYISGNTFTVEASIGIPMSMTDISGVICGSYNGTDPCFNIEITKDGNVRLYFKVLNEDESISTYDYIFKTDIRRIDIINLAVAMTRGTASLYIDGKLAETIQTADFDIPSPERKLTIGGDMRNGNTKAFKGTMYSFALFKDIRTADEISCDIGLPDTHDISYCVGYNLVNEALFTGDTVIDNSENHVAVSTAAQLEEYAGLGIPEIEITDSFVLDRTIYAISDVTIYSDSDVSITRDPSFLGDMFVVGENSAGRNLVLDGISCSLTLGSDEAKGTLTIDGNKGNTVSEVYGSLAFVSNSGCLTVNDGVILKNNRKTANQRALRCQKSYANMIGGAAILNITGCITINGGEISGNEVNFYCPAKEIAGAENYHQSIYGGAIFSASTLYINGGVIAENSAYYGGAVADFLYAKITKGIFRNNSSSHAGGAVYMYNSDYAKLFAGVSGGDVSGLIFDGNDSTGSSGGAIYTGKKSTALIHGGVTFRNNHAKSNGGALHSGGYMEVEGPAVFENNSANGKGGAIYVADQSDTETRRSCRFSSVVCTGNKAKYGGAFGSYGGDVEISGTFASNSATVSGGALYLLCLEDGSDSMTVLSASELTGNTAPEGGAVFSDKYCRLSVSDCTFSNNASTKTHGGAISLHGSALTVSNSVFSENAAENNAGACYVSYRTEKDAEGNPIRIVNGTAAFGNCKFNGNTAKVNGGAIYTLGDYSADGCTFSGNSASEENGGALYANASGAILNCVFSENSCNANGGAVAVYTAGNTLTLNDNTFDKNSATGNGGGLYVNKASAAGAGNVFSGNAGSRTIYGGGAVYSTGGTVSLENTVFSGNAAFNGGAVAGYSKSVITLTGLTASENTADFGGGFAYLSKSDMTVVASEQRGVEIKGNSAKSGGAFYADSIADSLASLSVTGALISNNSASGSGGALYSNNCTEVFEFTDCDISGNTAAEHGGALICYGGDATFNRVTFSGNKAAAGMGGAFYVRENGDATVFATVNANNCIFRENSAAKTGGAAHIKAGSKLISDDAVFDANAAAGAGGAVYTLEAYTVKGCTFSGNTSAGSGGAVYTQNDFTANGCTFSGNSSSGESGGAVYADASASIQNCVFSENSCKANGGAIAVYTAGHTLSFSNNTFDKNSASGNGGGLYVNKATASGAGNVFSDNTGSRTGYGGGAIYSTGGTVSLENTEFSGNAAFNGGAVAGYSKSKITLTDLTATENTADNYGGFAYLNKSEMTVTVSEQGDAEIKSNSAKSGGAFYAESVADSLASITVTGAKIQNNTANGGGALYSCNGTKTFAFTDCVVSGNSAGNGGALLCYGGDATFTRVTFSANTTTGLGGAFYIRENGDATVFATVTANNCTFSENTSKNTGGAAYIKAGSAFTANDSVFTSNTAASGGGAIYALGECTANGCTFCGNSSSGENGGAIAVYTAGNTLTINDNTFDKNSAAGNGGALYVSKATVTGDGNVFSDNTGSLTAYGGGAIYSTGGTVSLENTEFSGNAAFNGGAVAGYSKSKITLTDLTATENTADNYGGFAYLNKSEMTVTVSEQGDAEIKSNSAKSGGAFYAESVADSLASITVTGAKIQNNTANGGGALYSGSGTKTFALMDCVVSGNSAGNGGALLCYGGDATFTRVTFSENTTTGMGGAFYIRENADSTVFATVTANNCTFSENTAKSTGGAIAVYTAGNTLTINNNTFDKNSASGNGGALYVSKATVTGAGNVFSDNTGSLTSYGGGAIYSTGGTVYLENTEFAGNTALNGAAVAGYSESNITFVDVKASNNTADNAGGFAYINKSVMTVGKSEQGVAEIKSNSAKSGGAFYAEAATGYTASASVTGADIKNNYASGSGGAVYANNGAKNIVFTDCSISDNSAAYGGAVIAYGGEAVFNNVTFSENSSTSGFGGAMYIRENKDSTVFSEVTANGCTFSSNTSSGTGGAVYLKKNSVFNASNSSFVKNTAVNEGGAVYAAGTFNADGCTFTDNTAAGGGAVLLESAAAEISNSSFEANSAAAEANAYGGAVYSRSAADSTDRTALVLTNTDFIENTAGAEGGAIYADNTDCEFNGGDISGNHSDGMAGGVTVRNGSVFDVSSANVSGNTASTNGGVFYVNRATLNIIKGESENDEIVFGTKEPQEKASKGNSGSNGGVIYATVSSVVNVDGAYFGYNSATSNGGVIDGSHATGAVITVTNSEFVGNTAKTGGAIFGELGSSLSVQNTSFTSNSASNGGGAVYVKGSAKLDLDSCSFTSNSSTAAPGGALYVSTDSAKTSTVSKCVFTENSAEGHGGGIYATYGPTIEFTDVSLIRNTATGDGNGMSLTYTTVNGVKLVTTVTINSLTIDQPDGVPVHVRSAQVHGTVVTSGITDVNDPSAAVKNNLIKGTLTNISFV